jgi:hypothetical protein
MFEVIFGVVMVWVLVVSLGGLLAWAISQSLPGDLEQ